MKTLKVLSYNIHKGFSTGNQNFVLRKIKQSIEQVHADLVFLQEVVGHHEVHRAKINDWPTIPQFEFLADKVWPHYAYGKNAVYSAGHHGNAILSKYPIVRWENVNISTNQLEQRGMLHAEVEIPGKKENLHAICVHLGLFETGRRLQVQGISERIESMVSAGAPLVVGGDFNDWRERASAELKKRLSLEEVFMSTSGRHARTFPSWMPVLKLDRIYVRGVEIVAAEVLTQGLWSELSDHAAIFSELRFPKNK